MYEGLEDQMLVSSLFLMMCTVHTDGQLEVAKGLRQEHCFVYSQHKKRLQIYGGEEIATIPKGK